MSPEKVVLPVPCSPASTPGNIDEDVGLLALLLILLALSFTEFNLRWLGFFIQLWLKHYGLPFPALTRRYKF